jgi:hypothetical protein
MTEQERATLVLKGMLTTNKPTTQKQNNMPQTIKLKLAAKNAEKIHSRVFEATTENDVVRSIYFMRPFANNVKEITIVVTRDIDAKIDSL